MRRRRRQWLVALLVGGATAAAPAAASADGSWTFNYTGSSQAFQVPAGVHSIHVIAFGGAGGRGDSPDEQNANGGDGAEVVSDIPVSSGETFGVWVGGAGSSPAPQDAPFGHGGAGGSASGIAGAGGPGGSGAAAASGGGGGGGATELTDLGANVILAAGGGGGGAGDGFAPPPGTAEPPTGTNGGNGGAPPQSAASNGFSSGGVGGGSGGPDGTAGGDTNGQAVGGGGGGGGGGYPTGGTGGTAGAGGAGGGGGGGGGGAGSSYLEPGLSASYLGYGVATPDGSGRLTITWVRPTPSVKVKASKAQVAQGAVETFTATVKPPAGDPTTSGTVTFIDQTTGQTLGTASLSATIPATAKLSTTALPHGTNAVSATYSGDGIYDGASSGTVQVTVFDRHVTLTPTSLAFGTKAVGSRMTATVTVKSTGLDPVTVSSSAVSSAPFAIAGSTCAGATLNPGQTCTISVAFAPTAAGSFRGTLEVTDNATPTLQTVKLSGAAQ